MVNLISKVFNRSVLTYFLNKITSRILAFEKLLFGQLKKFQIEHFLPMLLVGLFLVTTNTVPPGENKALGAKIREQVHQDDSVRPKTTGEWHKEAAQDVPISQRMRDIGKESAEAFKEFGSGYVEGAQKTADDIKEGAAKLEGDLSK